MARLPRPDEQAAAEPVGRVTVRAEWTPLDQRTGQGVARQLARLLMVNDGRLPTTDASSGGKEE